MLAGTCALHGSGLPKGTGYTELVCHINSGQHPTPHFLPLQVPNIKFNVAKQLQGLAPLLNPTVVTQQIKPCLQELMEDDDTDVKYFAQQAMQACNSLTVGA